jgi:predicted ribonuclease YlaK
MEQQLDRVRSELLGRNAEDYRNSLTATRSLESGLSQLRDQAKELASQDARALVERFGQMGRRKLQLAG